MVGLVDCFLVGCFLDVFGWYWLVELFSCFFFPFLLGGEGGSGNFWRQLQGEIRSYGYIVFVGVLGEGL